VGKAKKDHALGESHHTDGGGAAGALARKWGRRLKKQEVRHKNALHKGEMLKIGLPPLKIESRTKFM